MTAATATDGGAPNLGWLAFAAAGLSMAICYIVRLAGLVAPRLDASVVSLNPHVQALLMGIFAVVAVVAIARDRRRHGWTAPTLVATLGLLTILGTLYVYYDHRLETLGYVLLVFAAFMNQHAALRALNRTVEAQAAELAALNASLERQVEDQVGEIERLAQLKRFLAPEVAELIMREGKGALLNSHRAFVGCLFCDIRNFTALSEGVEPEEVMQVLQDFHGRVGRLVAACNGTIGARTGDGFMVVIGDPVAVDAPSAVALELARQMMTAFQELRQEWSRLGYDIGFGIGLASGYATLGLIGDESRYDYTAIGNTVNLAARLCQHAADGEIWLNRRAFADVEDRTDTGAAVGASVELKGFERPVEAFCIRPPVQAN